MDASAAIQDLGQDAKTLIAMGKIGRPHGVQGELRFWPHNGAGRLLCENREIWVGSENGEGSAQVSGLRAYCVRSARRDPKGWLISLDGIDDRDQAAALCGLTWFEKREAFEPLQEGELYLVDLIGCQVRTPSRENMGRLIDVCEAAGNQYLVVQTGKEERLVPARREFIVECDLNARVLTLVDLEGLLQD